MFFCSSVNEHGTQGCHFLPPSLIVDGKNNRIFVAPLSDRILGKLCQMVVNTFELQLERII